MLLCALALSLVACSGGDSDDQECVPGEERADVVCSSAGTWVARQGTPASEEMAIEVDGACIFNPGTYVVTYRVLGATASCGTVSPLVDEYITISDGGSILGATEVPPGCADSEPLVEGCFVAFDRNCSNETAIGRLESNVDFQFEYAEGSGLVTLTGRLYSGETLLDVCNITQEATISRR
jgi:hypothetical protein